MADNTTLNTGTGGDVIATDDIGGIKVQRVKFIIGNDGVNNGDVSATNPLPITAPVAIPVAGALLTSIDTKTLAAGQSVMASSSPVVIASNQTPIPVTIGAGAVILGSYGAGAAFVGTVGASNLLSIENPAASGRTVVVRRASLGAGGTAAVNPSATLTLSRTTATPTAGTVITAQKRKTADAAPVGIVRSVPTATAAAGVYFSTNTPGGNPPSFATIEAIQMDYADAIELAAGEGLLVSQSAGDIDATFSVSFYWQEV